MTRSIAGELWACDCGRKVRTLARMRQHMIRVTDPDAHRPQITVRLPDNRIGPVQPVANQLQIPDAHSSPEAVIDPPATETARPDPEFTSSESRLVNRDDSGLPFACSCTARFPTAKDWADHRKAQPTGLRNRHRIVEQPVSVMVPTGIRLAPPSRADAPEVVIVEPHTHRPSVVA
jgi:hypothetical protein